MMKSGKLLTIMVNDTISQIENEYEVTFAVTPSDIASNPIAVDEAWLDDANVFLDEYIATSAPRLRNAAISSLPNAEQVAKSSSIIYAANRAAFGLQRNPTLDPSLEAQYMFISHYIDRFDYYWGGNDANKLLDGAAMSGENGYLANWLTGNDRRSYQLYMGQTSINESMQKIGNIAIGILNYHETPSNIVKCTDTLVKANKVYAAGYSMGLVDEITGVHGIIQNDIVPFLYNVIQQDPTIHLGQLYDMHMNDDELLNTHSEEDKSAIILTAVSMVGAAIVGGLGAIGSAAVTTIVCSTLGITLETFTNYFNYDAYVVLRYGFSGRYADRTSYYLSTIM